MNRNIFSWVTPVRAGVFVGLCIAALILYKNSQQNERIQAPVAEADIPFTTHNFDVSQPILIEQPSGTALSIPPFAFTDKSGKPVKGNVALSVREFHNAGDLLRAGIPMNLSEGSDATLQSAGMLEFRAFQGNNELELGEGKSIQVELAALRPSEGYDLYYLRGDNEWEVTDTFSLVDNERRQQRISCLKEEIYQRCGIASPEEEVTFEIGGYVEEGNFISDLSGIKWLLCPLLSDSNYTTALRELWESTILKKPEKGDYLFSMKYSRMFFEKWEEAPKIRTFNASALPSPDDVNGLPDWGKLLAKLERLDGRFNKIAEVMEKNYKDMIEMTERIRNEAELVNTFRANQMGIYNIDKVQPINDSPVLALSFDFEDEFEDKKLIYLQLYCVFEQENSVIPIRKNDWKKVQLRRGTPISMIVVLPNGTCAVVGADELERQLATGKRSIHFTTRREESVSYLKSLSKRPDPV